ncbi:DNA methylase [bacterium]|nr:DNA methylase [bacterium]
MAQATKINDLNLKEWKKYQDIWTDSLWIIGSRDRSGGHSNSYHGNFVPQIPNQLIRRFTKRDDVVLDTFLGSGTTLIEARQLGRNGIGVELLKDVANIAQDNLSQGSFFDKKTSQSIVVGDSTKLSTRTVVNKSLAAIGKEAVQMIIMHPPYHDIIKFSKDAGDLSNAESVESFCKMFGEVVDNFVDLLEPKRHLAVVIGDKYSESEWVPLSSYVMQEVMKRPSLRLKSVVVKNMVNNRAKRNQEQLWRYRALAGGFYVFRHEYILLFQKK